MHSVTPITEPPEELGLTLLLIPSYKDAADADADLELLKNWKFLLLMADIHRSTGYPVLNNSISTHALYSTQVFEKLLLALARRKSLLSSSYFAIPAATDVPTLLKTFSRGSFT